MLITHTNLRHAVSLTYIVLRDLRLIGSLGFVVNEIYRQILELFSAINVCMSLLSNLSI